MLCSLPTVTEEPYRTGLATDLIVNARQGVNASNLAKYQRGDWGPKEADELLVKNGREWLQSCIH